MVGWPGPFPDDLGRSRHCAAGKHQDCGHLAIAFRGRRGGRLQSTIVLCRCDCHEACSLTAWEHVPLTAWQELCECPGAAFQRTWKEDIDDPWPGAREQRDRRWRAEQERKESRHQAFRAASEAAPGKTRRQVRELYLAELRARGVADPVYDDDLLEAEVDAIMRRPLRALARLGHAMLKLTREETL
ncbi:MAG TPA: hypothetical protein VMA73_21835 [Streptosporangiaceae bacterium]|nr:hypothetical protein [Streptosporangiaceae bacterium]